MKIIKRLDNTSVTPFWLRPKNWVLLQASQVSGHVVSWVGVASGVGYFIGLPTSPSIIASVAVAIAGGGIVSGTERYKNSRQKAIKKFGTPELEIADKKTIRQLSAKKKPAAIEGSPELKSIEATSPTKLIKNRLYQVYEFAFDRTNPQILDMNKTVISYSFALASYYDKLSAEEQYALESTIGDIYPELLEHYVSLPLSQKAMTTESSRILVDQLGTISAAVIKMYGELNRRRIDDMRVKSDFLRERFSEAEGLTDNEKTVPSIEKDNLVSLNEEDRNDLWSNFKSSYEQYRNSRFI